MGESRILSNNEKAMERRRKRKSYPNVFFKKEMTILFDHFDEVRTMFASFLTFFCALRLNEACELKWKDIDLQEGRLKVVDGKGHKDEFVPISPIALPIIVRWREMNPNEEYVVPTDRFKRGCLQKSSLYKDYKKVLKKAGMLIPTEKNSAGNQQHQYKFHTLRHSRCTHLLSNNVPVHKVQKFMRHDKIETTMVYTWILDKEMNNMVKEVDQPKKNIPTPMAHLAGIKPLTNQESNPLQVARNRLVYGEISIKEYKKLEKALGA